MRWIVARLNTKKTLGMASVLVVIALGATYSLWWPTFSSFIDRTLQQRRAVNAPVDEHAGHDHGAEGHEDHAGHDHAAHDESTALELNAHEPLSNRQPQRSPVSRFDWLCRKTPSVRKF